MRGRVSEVVIRQGNGGFFARGDFLLVKTFAHGDSDAGHIFAFQGPGFGVKSRTDSPVSAMTRDGRDA